MQIAAGKSFAVLCTKDGKEAGEKIISTIYLIKL